MTNNKPDFFPLRGIHHVELYVNDPWLTTNYLCVRYGFNQAGHFTQGGTSSYLITQGAIRFIVTGSVDPSSPIYRHVEEHGDSVKDIAFEVPDARRAHRRAVERGAISVISPTENDGIVRATVQTFIGNAVHHTFVQRRRNAWGFLPEFVPMESPAKSVGLRTMDHTVFNTYRGGMNLGLTHYADVYGFTNLINFSDQQIKTEYTSLMSKVMQGGNGEIKIPINEPAGETESHIDTFLKEHRGPGIQHIALATDDIVGTVAQLYQNGVEFLPIHPEYYVKVRNLFPDVRGVDIDALARHGILIDVDEKGGVLLQIFTKEIFDREMFRYGRKTLFFEIIQRLYGATGFGIRNFKTLFEVKEAVRMGTSG